MREFLTTVWIRATRDRGGVRPRGQSNEGGRDHGRGSCPGGDSPRQVLRRRVGGREEVAGSAPRDFTKHRASRRTTRTTKVVFSFMAPGCQILGSALISNYQDVAWVNPNYTFLIVLGSMLGKATPVFEAAEKLWLQSGGVAHCGNVKCALGLLALNMVPKPDLAITSGFLCDTGAKTIGLIEDWYGIPGYYFDCWQDRELREYPHADRSTSFHAKSLQRLSERVGQQFGFEIRARCSGRSWRQGRPTWRQGQSARPDAKQRSDPLGFRSSQLDVRARRDPLQTERAGGCHRDRWTLCIANCLIAPRRVSGRPPRAHLGCWVSSRATTPIRGGNTTRMKLAWRSSPRTSSSRRAKGSTEPDPRPGRSLRCDRPAPSLRGPADPRREVEIILDACKRLHLDGVLNHYHVGCRYVAGDAMTIKNAVTKELGIPALTFEWDNFDPRSYNHEQYKANLETFWP